MSRLKNERHFSEHGQPAPGQYRLSSGKLHCQEFSLVCDDQDRQPIAWSDTDHCPEVTENH